jgi:hypothetical protein
MQSLCVKAGGVYGYRTAINADIIFLPYVMFSNFLLYYVMKFSENGTRRNSK